MDDEAAEASLRNHLSYCRACEYFISIHSMNGSVKKTIKIMLESIEKYEKEEGEVLNW